MENKEGRAISYLLYKGLTREPTIPFLNVIIEPMVGFIFVSFVMMYAVSWLFVFIAPVGWLFLKIATSKDDKRHLIYGLWIKTVGWNKLKTMARVERFWGNNTISNCGYKNKKGR